MGDGVLTNADMAVAAPSAAHLAGAEPVYVALMIGYRMDAADFKCRIQSSGVKLEMLFHILGKVADMDVAKTGLYYYIVKFMGESVFLLSDALPAAACNALAVSMDECKARMQLIRLVKLCDYNVNSVGESVASLSEFEVARYISFLRCSASNSCRESFHMVLAVGVKLGDGVLMSADLAVATPSAVHLAGAEPVHVALTTGYRLDVDDFKCRIISSRAKFKMISQLLDNAADMAAAKTGLYYDNVKSMGELVFSLSGVVIEVFSTSASGADWHLTCAATLSTWCWKLMSSWSMACGRMPAHAHVLWRAEVPGSRLPVCEALAKNKNKNHK